MLYLVTLPETNFVCVVSHGEAGQAAMKADEVWQGDDRVEEAINEAGSLEAYEAQCLASYSVTEITRKEALEYINRALDGERINVVL
jgi:hypothetical protein